MRIKRHFAAVLVGAAALSLLPHPPPSLATRVSPTSVATQLMTTTAVVKRWMEFLYHIHAPGGGGCEEQSEFTLNPDGSFTQRLLTSNCTRIVTTTFPGNGFASEIHYRDGLTEKLRGIPTAFLPEPAPFPTQYSFTDVLSSGSRAAYQVDFDIDDPSIGSVSGEHYKGTFTTGRQRLHFTRFHNDDPFVTLPDHFTTTLPGGVALALDIPYDLFNDAVDFSQPVSGTLRLRGQSLIFNLVSHNPGEPDQHWDTLTAQSGQDRRLQGTFHLEPDFSGRGQMLRGRQVVFVAQWNSSATARLVLASGQATNVGPVRSALDLLNLRWSGLSTAFGPQPGL